MTTVKNVFGYRSNNVCSKEVNNRSSVIRSHVKKNLIMNYELMFGSISLRFVTCKACYWMKRERETNKEI